MLTALTATALVAALGVAATPVVVVASLANPPAAVAKKKKCCKNGRWSNWHNDGTTYPGTSDGSEGGPAI